METRGRAEHVVFVHAHPDDETIETGGTIAKLIADGIDVTVLTATRGERGEVIPDELAHLRDDHEALARFREQELAEAMRALGVRDHRYLGSAGARAPGLEERRYTDSGMRWGSDGHPAPVEPLAPGALAAADRREVARDVLAVLRDTDATAVVTYNDFGGYGHPDHIAIQRATVLAARDAAVPAFAVETPMSVADSGYRAVRDAGFFEPPRHHDAVALDDSLVPLRIDVSAQLPQKVAALRAHRTQVTVIDHQFGLSNGVGRVIADVECYRPLRVPEPPSAREPRSQRALGFAFAVLAGVVVGLLGTAAHRFSPELLGVPVPLGLVLALAAVATLLLGLRAVLPSRSHAVAAAVGLLAAVVVLSLPGPGGSVLFPDSPLSIIWTFAPAVIAVLVLAWPRLPERRR
jgi:N-acetyl-1-D-myo-inositol-2-amino-2-deoxy-alpha-D-glucopyranoside deacetylase